MRLRSGVFARAAPVPRMPGGLAELMEGLTRDVLRHNPPDVLDFCAQHMEQLVLIRDGRAPPKQRLTLEQKIIRAQEKVRERAEQRRLKYDEEKLNQGSSSEEVKQDISGQEEKPILKEEENSANPVIEAKLKAPVHHEQDLAEALEVEIFHKPVEETRGIVTTESKNLNEISQKQSMERDDNVNENVKNTSTSEEPNHLGSVEKENISLADNDLTGLLEQVITNENLPQDSNNHVRTRRSASLKDNDEDAEKAENQKYSYDVADDVKPDLQDNNQTGEVTNTSENDHNGGIEDLNEHTNTDQNDTDLKDIITNTTDVEFNCAPGTSNTSPDDVKTSNDGDRSDVTKDGNKTETLTKLSEQDRANELTMIEKFPLDDSLVNTVQTDENIEKLESLEASTEIEKTNNENANQNKMTENILTIEIANDDTSHEKEEYIGQSTTSATANENYSVKEKSEFTADTKSYSELNDDNDTIIEKTLENIVGQDCDSVENQLYKKPETNGDSNVEREKVILLDDEEKIIKAINELEVCIIPIGKCSDNKDEGLNMYEKFTSEDSRNIVEEQPTEAPVDKEELVVETESVTEENSDGAITSIDKILVDEPSAVKDDNYSVPEQHIVENTSTEDNMNGTHEISNLECIENGNESPRREIIPSQDDTKEVEIISEIQDDVTNTSEPLKTDLETSSLGKSSSMDDSFIDEGVDIITESDEMKPNSESTQSKPNQSGMDLETAAITIQKVFRTFLFKSRESTFDDTGMGGNSIDGDSEKTEVEFPVTTAPLNKERRALGISRMDTVLQTVNEEKSLSLSDDSSLSSAATIIQAHVRGFLTRNRLNSNKTNSLSLVNSDGQSSTSFENDLDQKASKTVLNIHIVPEGEHFLSRDESLLTSMELSLDGSPPTSTNLHPLGYDKSEPRKQLKREDAIQSISPPSNNSGKLSEDIDSVKDMPMVDSDQQKVIDISKDEAYLDADIDRDDTPTKSTTIETVIEAHKLDKEDSSTAEPAQEEVDTVSRRKRSLVKVNSDEGDVVTPFEDKSSTDSDATSRLLHSGEFHDVVLPTKVSRGDTSVVREFKNVLVYFLMWNNS